MKRRRGRTEWWSRRVALVSALFGLAGVLWGAAPLRAQVSDLGAAESGLRRALDAGNPDDIAHWVEQLGATQNPRAIRMILGVGERFVEDPIRTSVQQALAWSKSESCLRFYRNTLEKPSNPIRALLVIEALGRIDQPEANDVLCEALQEIGRPRLQVEIVRALRSKPTRQTVEALVRFYPKVYGDQGLLWAETRITLMTITRQEYILAEDWSTWWLTQKETWEPLPRGIDREERRARTAVYHTPTHGDLKLPRLFGQEILSKRIVFAIDTSQSMREPIEGDAEEGGGNSGRTRLDYAKAELIQAIQDLRPDVRFNIIAYNTRVIPWRDAELLRATPANKRRALKFVEGWRPEGYTNILDAVLLGVSYPEVDTLILLSDGSPTSTDSGRLAEIPPILEEVRRKNRFQGVAIHTLGFEGAKVSFMKALAEQNSGTYRAIR